MDTELFKNKLDWIQYKIRTFIKGDGVSTPQELVNDLSNDIDKLQSIIDGKEVK